MSSEWEEIQRPTVARIIWATMIAALLVSAPDLPKRAFFWWPDWAAMTLFFWIINRPQSVGPFAAFCMGLGVDLLTNSLAGSHSLAYVLSAFMLARSQSRISSLNVGGQSLAALMALLQAQIVYAAALFFAAGVTGGWAGFIAPFVGAALWPLFNKAMMQLLVFVRR